MTENSPSPKRRKSIRDIAAFKNAAPIVALTAYTAPVARLLDEYVDLLLVGDSLGMVLYGMESTLQVTLDMMIAHGKAVVKSSRTAFVVVDMPFGSYQGSPEAAFNAAARIISETGCQAVKLEGGAEMAPTIQFLNERGIPVMAHVGLMPQHVNSYGGYRYQGRTKMERDKIMKDAMAAEESGAFAIVLEGIESDLAIEITEKLCIPTIGIGASIRCDGQILVVDDMLGFTPIAPRFAKKYADGQKFIKTAVARYAKDVRLKKFPGPTYIFKDKK